MVAASPDPAALDPEQFARLVAAWEDDGLIVEGLRAAGVEAVLDRIFDEMAARLRPERADGIDAEVLWRIDVRGERHEYVLRIADGEGQVVRTAADPSVTFTMDLATFARLATGQADPIHLLFLRRLRVSGNLLLARRIPTLFAMPRPHQQGS